MKKFFFLFFVVLLKFSIPEDSFAKTPVNSAELIIQVIEAQPGRNLSTIQNALQNIGGVTVVDFCNSQKCFYLNVDRTIQPDDKNIIEAILDLGYHIEIKTSGTIQQATSDCKDRN